MVAKVALPQKACEQLVSKILNVVCVATVSILCVHKDHFFIITPPLH